jgi:Ca2+-binding EF-hand superfamily protein
MRAALSTITATGSNTMVHGLLRSTALWFAASVIASAAIAQPAPNQNNPTTQPPRVSAIITPPPQTASDPTTQIFLPKLSAGITLSRYLESLRQEFRRLDADGDNELTGADADFHENVARAMVQATIAMTILRADLDGDGFVTQAELRKALRYDQRMNTTPQSLDTIETEVRQWMAADADGDGRISVAEVLAFAANPRDVRPRAATNAPGPGQFVNAMLALNQIAKPLADEVRCLLPLGRDGKVTMADFDAAATAVFRAVDTDGNGTISQDELNGYRKREADAARERQEAATRAECALPKASDGAGVAVLSAYKSEAISTVGLGSQDVATGTGEIRIEAGEGPLYIVAISHEPTIWRVTGATDRVERLVAFGVTAQSNHITIAANPVPVSSLPAGQPNATPRPVTPPQPIAVAGISGLPADRVSFLARSNCLRSFTEAKSTDGAFVLAAVRRDAGKEPSMVAARQNAAAFSVPSGQIRSAYEDKKQPRLTIVKEAGVLTLKGDSSGVIVRTGPTDLESDLEQFSPGGVIDIDARTVIANAPAVRYEVLPGAAGLLQLENSGALTRNQRGEFLIHRKIRFPAGLAPLSPTFLLLRGVEMPEGHPDGAKVISEETGQQIKF